MSETGHGFQISYPAITLHAVSRPQDRPPFVYCQLDEGTQTDSDDDSDLVMRELSITPRNPASRVSSPPTSLFLVDDLAVNSIFEALSACASLHPDPDTSDDDSAFISSDAFTPFNGTEDELTDAGRVRSDAVHRARFAPY